MTINSPEKKWGFLPANQGKPFAEIPPLISTLLSQRGITSQAEAHDFLNPSFTQLPLPTEMSGLAEAVAILEQGLVEKKTVLVYGDYDADGITATALLLSFFKEIGLACCYYIPDRLTEGYGLNSVALQRLRTSSELVDCREPILLTVDCGISAHLEVKEAQRLGFTVIITDHHQPSSRSANLPAAESIVNPHKPGCRFPDKNLAGVGVAFYLVAALRSRLVEKQFWGRAEIPNLKKYLDLVAIGSIADMVPLTGVNRILVKAGLEVIATKPRVGIKALMKNSGLLTASINSGQISFQLAPRINAAGRVGDPRLAVQLLIAEKTGPATEYADKLAEDNDYRKKLSDEIFIEASLQADQQIAKGKKTLVLVAKAWHLGVLGLVAARIARAYHRPTVVLAKGDDGVARGSVRSIETVNVFAIIEECADLLEKYGGHRAAAGLTLKNKVIDAFATRFEGVLIEKLAGFDWQPLIKVSLATPMTNLLDHDFLNYYEKMEPFGKGNEEPIFLTDEKNTILVNARKIGADSMRFLLKGNDCEVSGVAFGMAHLLPAVKDKSVDMVFKLTKNVFRGTTKWEVRAEDIKVNA